ncbi:hypothetical protein VOLCADRAFT_92803, partial [Volvox carteri f. nagariensis]
RGLPVRVFESGPGLRREGAALSLWANAWRALDALGVGEELRRGHVLLIRVELCSSGGELLRAFDLSECDVGPENCETRGLMRSTLLQALYDNLPDREAVVEFGTTVREVLTPQAGDGQGPIAVRLSDGRIVYGSVLIGSDGVGSEVARYLQLPSASYRESLVGWLRHRLETPLAPVPVPVPAPVPVTRTRTCTRTSQCPSARRYSGYCAYRGVATFPDPGPWDLDSGAAGAAREPESGSGSGPGGLSFNTIRQIWGAGVRAGMYPITRNSVYWFTCYNETERAASQPPASPEDRRRAALESVAGWNPSNGIRTAIAATSPEDITWSRISDRWTVGAFGRGLVTLVGDAAHPMTPNLGQGGCTALEDAVQLARRLGALAKGAGATGSSPLSPADVASALRSYEYERSSRCLPIAVRSNLMGTALQNPLPPVVLARNAFVRLAFSPGHFLDHTLYDCGRLDELQ